MSLSILFSSLLMLGQMTVDLGPAPSQMPPPKESPPPSVLPDEPLQRIPSPPTPPAKRLPLGQFNPGAPPNPNSTRGGAISPIYSQANAEAAHFLALMDQHAYKSAWGDAGPLLKDVVTADQFSFAMEGVRTPLGNLQVRKTPERGAQNHTESLPHGTRGLFVILNFDSTFSGSRQAKESVTLMQNDRGEWRVIAYQVKPNK